MQGRWFIASVSVARNIEYSWECKNDLRLRSFFSSAVLVQIKQTIETCLPVPLA